MVKCTYCGKVIEPGTGLLLVKNDSSLSYFCSGKCEKNSGKLHRDSRKLKWTESFIKHRNKA